MGTVIRLVLDLVKTAVPVDERPHPVLERRARRVADGGGDPLEAGARFRDIGGLGGKEIKLGGAPDEPGEQLDHFPHLDRPVMA